MLKMTAISAATVLTGMIATAAVAQAPDVDMLLLDMEQLTENGMMEARILEADYDDRTLTVRLTAEDETARLIVPENAEIMQPSPNNLEQRMQITDLMPGDHIEIEGVEVEGAIHMRITGVPM